MKPVKAIDLVWKAQPLIATLRKIMVDLAGRQVGKGAPGTVASDCDQWLRDANEVLSRGRK